MGTSPPGTGWALSVTGPVGHAGSPSSAIPSEDNGLLSEAREPPSVMGDDLQRLYNSKGTELSRQSPSHSVQVQNKKYLMS